MEWVMRRNCPEIGPRGGGRTGGVKAPEGWRSPRPGGLWTRLGQDECRWGFRRVSEADGGRREAKNTCIAV